MSINQVLLIDDHPLVNYGIASCLEETGCFAVVAMAASLTEAQNFIEETQKLPELILLDIILGEENGLDFLPFLENHCLKKSIDMPLVLVFSVLDNPFNVQRALNLGAAGYISKTSVKAELLTALIHCCGEKFIFQTNTMIY